MSVEKVHYCVRTLYWCKKENLLMLFLICPDIDAQQECDIPVSPVVAAASSAMGGSATATAAGESAAAAASKAAAADLAAASAVAAAADAAAAEMRAAAAAEAKAVVAAVQAEKSLAKAASLQSESGEHQVRKKPRLHLFSGLDRLFLRLVRYVKQSTCTQYKCTMQNHAATKKQLCKNSSAFTRRLT